MAEKENKYIPYEELRQDMKATVRSAIRVNNLVKELTKEIGVEKEKLGKHKSAVLDFLEQHSDWGITGIKVEPDNLLYMQDSVSAPSFKQVLEYLRKDLPAPVVGKLEKAYKKLTVSNGNILMIK
jgi:hypothetical protein